MQMKFSEDVIKDLETNFQGEYTDYPEIDAKSIVKKIKECNIADFDSTKALLLYIGEIKNKHKEICDQQMGKSLFFPRIKPAPIKNVHGEYMWSLTCILSVLSCDLKGRSENVFNQLKIAHKEAEETLGKAIKEKAGPFIIKPLEIATTCLNVQYLGVSSFEYFARCRDGNSRIKSTDASTSGTSPSPTMH